MKEDHLLELCIEHIEVHHAHGNKAGAIQYARELMEKAHKPVENACLQEQVVVFELLARAARASLEASWAQSLAKGLATKLDKALPQEEMPVAVN